MISGVFLQLERALFHLSHAGFGEAVAVELVDDVSRHKDGVVTLQEQDKNTLSRGKKILGDRSMDLWRTLQIWVQGYRDSNRFCGCYLLVTNANPAGAVSNALRLTGDNSNRADLIVEALRAAAVPSKGRRSKANAASKIQTVIDDVMGLGEDRLRDLADRIELVESFDSTAARPDVAARLGISPDVERDVVLNALMGWLVEELKTNWSVGEPGMITKEACLRQVRAIELQVVRRRLLPRPASEITVPEAEMIRARARPFVDHLGRIEAEPDEVLQAIEHFVQFNTERYRLAKEGEIPVQEWSDRGRRLRQRWQNVARQVSLNHGDKSRIVRGKHILAETTYHHHESLAGQDCGELYMTSGHYHRLADESAVWWDPEFQGS